MSRAITMTRDAHAPIELAGRQAIDDAARYEDVLVLDAVNMLEWTPEAIYLFLAYASHNGVEVRIVPRETFQILSGQKQRPTHKIPSNI